MTFHLAHQVSTWFLTTYLHANKLNYVGKGKHVNIVIMLEEISI